MLILTRDVGEVIKIGDEIDLVVISTRNGQARLGVSAPKTTEVHRIEVYKRIQKKKMKEAEAAAALSRKKSQGGTRNV